MSLENLNGSANKLIFEYVIREFVQIKSIIHYYGISATDTMLDILDLSKKEIFLPTSFSSVVFKSSERYF